MPTGFVWNVNWRGSSWIQGNIKMIWLGSLVLLSLAVGGCSLPEPPQTSETIPSEYENSHMPDGWWTDRMIIDEGRQFYLGFKKSNVNCAQCHGKSGQPVVTGALNFRDSDKMKGYSDSQLLWRISEGVPYSQMRAYKEKLSEHEIWKVIAFIATMGMDGLHYDAQAQGWVPSG